MQRIRPAVEVLSSGIGVEHALASRRLYTDGAEVLYDYTTEHDEEELGGLTVVRTGQREFAEIVRDYLVDRFVAGDTLADIAEYFGVPEPEVEDVVLVAARATP